jgi:hypothetical protein
MRSSPESDPHFLNVTDFINSDKYAKHKSRGEGREESRTERFYREGGTTMVEI